MGTNFPTNEVLSYFETGDKPTQAQFATFINGVAAIDDNSPLNNFTATTNPTVNDDNQDGYSVGSWWVNVSTGTIFTCTNANTGVAVWVSPSVADTLPFGSEDAIASANTVDLGSIPSHLAVVGGTTTTTSFGSSADLGAPIYLIRAASSGWTITLGPNITCTFATGSIVSVADTYYWLQYLGSSAWRVFATSRGFFPDNTFRVVGSLDSSKQVAFEVNGVTTATTRTLTIPDADGTVALTSQLPSAATDTTAGIVELATAAEVATGTDTSRVAPISLMPKTLVATGTASNSAAVEFTGLSSTYTSYEFQIYDFVPATDNAEFIVQYYISGVWVTGNYVYSGIWLVAPDSSLTGYGSGSDSRILVSAPTGGSGYSVSNTASEGGVGGTIVVQNPSSSARTNMTGHVCYSSATNARGVITTVSGANTSTTAVTGVRFLFHTGNVTSGTVKCFGLR